jgi:hypothetical protein
MASSARLALPSHIQTAPQIHNGIPSMIIGMPRQAPMPVNERAMPRKTKSQPEMSRMMPHVSLVDDVIGLLLRCGFCSVMRDDDA